MARAGGKGRVSNDLVAASCAAVLAVYAAGYWRTRDEARRIEVRAQERRPVRIEPPPPPVATLATTSIPVAAASKPVETAVTAAAPPEAIREISLPPVPAEASVAAIAAVAVASEIEPVPAAASGTDSLAAPSAVWRDGTYTGWGTSRHGDIKAQVVIRNGRIVESGIASCETRYPCDVITAIIQQPVERQKPDVDRVSRATESADAYYYGLVAALGEALVQPPDQAAPLR